MNVPGADLVRPKVSAATVADIAAWLGLTSSSKNPVLGATLDSRKAREGDIWFAVPGQTGHAMTFASQAVTSGVVAVITDAVGADIARESQSLPPEIELLVVEDPRACAGPVISRLYGHPSELMTVIGVTGTNGKTSVTHFLVDAWRSAAATTDCALLGTLGAVAPQHPELQAYTGFTTPEPDSLQAFLAACAEAGVRSLAMEVSSHALFLHRVDGTKFDVVVFTNLSQDHLDLHGSMTAYFDAKARLFNLEFCQQAVICVDDEWGQQLAHIARERGLSVTTYGFVESDWQIVGTDERSCTVNARGSVFTLTIPAPGRFMAANATAAAAALSLTGVALAQVQEMMKGIQTVPGRMEIIRVESSRGPRVIVDYAHSPGAIETVLAAARPASGRLIAVLGAGGDRDHTKRSLMGNAASAADVVVVTDDNPRSEDPAQIRAAIVSGISGSRCKEIADRAFAIQWAVSEADEQDTVVILGKGAEVGQTFGVETRPFDDRVQAAAALAQWRAK